MNPIVQTQDSMNNLFDTQPYLCEDMNINNECLEQIFQIPEQKQDPKFYQKEIEFYDENEDDADESIMEEQYCYQEDQGNLNQFIQESQRIYLVQGRLAIEELQYYSIDE